MHTPGPWTYNQSTREVTTETELLEYLKQLFRILDYTIEPSLCSKIEALIAKVEGRSLCSIPGSCAHRKSRWTRAQPNGPLKRSGRISAPCRKATKDTASACAAKSRTNRLSV